MKHCATDGALQVTSQCLPLTVLLHELSELAEFVVLVVPELSEVVIDDDVFESMFDDVFELTLELIDDDWSELIELLAPPPSVVALTVPDLELIVLEAA